MRLKCHGQLCLDCGAHYWYVEPHGCRLCTRCLYLNEQLAEGWRFEAIAKTMPWPDEFLHLLADFVLGGVRYTDNKITRKLASMYVLLTGPYIGCGVYWHRLTQTSYVRESAHYYNASQQLKSDLLMHILSYIITPSLLRPKSLVGYGPLCERDQLPRRSPSEAWDLE